MTRDDGGWAWFDDDAPPAPGNAEAARADRADRRALTEAAARCFRGRDGETVLAYLRAITLERALGPGAGDALLRHLEGQRQLVAHLFQLIRRGQDGECRTWDNKAGD
jgi:hypothetical protein